MLTEDSIENCKFTSLAGLVCSYHPFSCKPRGEQMLCEAENFAMSCKGKQVSCVVVFFKAAAVQVTFFVHPPVPAISLMSLAGGMVSEFRSSWSLNLLYSV